MQHYTTYEWEQVNSQTIFTFDIETTSYWMTPAGVRAYSENYTPEEYNDFPAGAVCYIWQFSIDNKVYYGRELSEFPKFLDTVFCNYETENEKNLPIIWVHNLSWEFAFIREYIKIDYSSIFARSIRKPMSFITAQYGKTCIEFRCSYILTGLSLDAWGKELGFEKLHTLDYCVLRTPLTKLKQKELDYAERDCLVVYNGICKYREKYETLQNIPKTQTGEVRREVKTLLQNNSYCAKITKMLPKTEDEYKLLRACFQGGSTGGNYELAGKILYNVASDDIQSDYPSQICTKKYPMSAFKECNTTEVTFKNFNDYAFIICVEFTNIKARSCLAYYSQHKAIAVKGAKINNGKIQSANYLNCVITECDLCIMNKCYDWETMNIIACFKAKKDYLPKEFIKITLERYGFKTSLKGIAEKKDIYDNSKRFINSLYGMCVTDLYQQEIVFNGSYWDTTEKSLQDTLDKLQRNKNRNFLSYAWGVWCTAYARVRLWIGSCDTRFYNENLGMLATPNDIIYYDTDSRKHYITEETTRVLRREDEINNLELFEMCKHYSIDYEKTRPKDPKGNARIIGAWDFEGVYDELVHLGAKKYATKTNGKIEVTVSGVPKSTGNDSITDLSQFKAGFEFSANHKSKDTGLYDGKKLVIYIDNNNLKETIRKGKYDEYTPKNNNGIALRNVGYKLGISSEYASLVHEGIAKGLIK